MTLDIPTHLQDKIFEIHSESNHISKFTSYFPFSESEKDEIRHILNDDTFNGFHSIFTDTITDEEWIKNRDQIKQRFKDELFDIDNF